jgi:DNA polymerase IIIc chi subunit
MIRVDFYHLQRAPLEQVLPKLCEKAYATGKRIKILLGTEERVEFINSLLWTYNEESFLPHGSKKDGFAEEQPIFISANEDNANNASLLILADGAMPDTETLKQYERILNISHKSFQPVRFYVEMDPTGDGHWMEYKHFDIAPGESFIHHFPPAVQARWIRFRTDSKCVATTWLEYK